MPSVTSQGGPFQEPYIAVHMSMKSSSSNMCTNWTSWEFTNYKTHITVRKPWCKGTFAQFATFSIRLLFFLSQHQMVLPALIGLCLQKAECITSLWLECDSDKKSIVTEKKRLWDQSPGFPVSLTVRHESRKLKITNKIRRRMPVALVTKARFHFEC